MNTFRLTAGNPVAPGAIHSYYQIDLQVMISPWHIKVAQVDNAQGEVLSLLEYSPDRGPDNAFSTDPGQFMREESLFNKPYRSVILGFDFPVSTLVPAGLFLPDRKESYLSAVHHPGDGQLLLSDEIRQEDIVNVYSLPAELVRTLRNVFPSAKMFHYLTSLISGLNLQARQHKQDPVFCQVSADRMDTLVYRSGRLVFANSFHFSNKEEFVYYLLFVLEQLSIPPSSRELILFGTAANEELLTFSEDFLGRAKVGFDDFDGWQGLISDIPSWHAYFNLLSLRLCV